MYRSASWNRVSDDYSSMMQPSPSPSPSNNKGTASSSSSMAGLIRMSSSAFEDGDEDHQYHHQQLPVYDVEIAEMAKKDRARLKFAENAVHLIPLVLILCAFILWFFSTTPTETEVGSKSIAARIEGLSIEGEIDNDSDGTQTGIIPTVDLGGLDSPRQRRTHPDHKASKKMNF